MKNCKVYVLIRADSDLLFMRASCTLWGKSSQHRAVVALSVLRDLLITNELLYRLSYTSVLNCENL